MTKTLFDFQKKGIQHIDALNGRCLLADEPGLGKELFIDTKVLTRDGWERIGTIKTGDVIYGKDGRLHSVMGVYPQGVKPLYNVVFSDGVKILAGLEHQWCVRTEADKYRNRPWRVKTTDELLNDIRFPNGNVKWEIPLVEPIQHLEKEFIIDPYILGVLIGDGSLQNSVKYVPGDDETPSLVASRLPNEVTQNKGADYGTSTAYYISRKEKFPRRNPFLDEIRSMGLNIHGDNKFIPKEYMCGSIDQRKDLLAGLLDTDGCAGKGGRTRFFTVSKQLADDVVELIQSLGGMSRYSVVKGKERNRNGKICLEKDVYHITVRTTFNPFKREFNKVRWTQSQKMRRAITSITYSHDAEAVCISVDAKDSLYVIEGHVITHNTSQSIYWVGWRQKFPCLIVCPSSLKINWHREIDMWLPGCTVQILNGRTPTKINPKAHFVIANYDIIGGWEKTLLEVGFASMLVDEHHMIKTPTSKRTTSVMMIGKTIPHYIAITGTPILSRPSEIWTALNILNEKEWPNWYSFAFRYCKAHKTTYGLDVRGHSNITELSGKLSKVMIRRLKKDVLPDLPKKIRGMLTLDIDNQSEYDVAMLGFSDWLKGGKAKNRMEGIAKLEYARQAAVKGKMKQITEWIENFLESGQKLVLFGVHREPLINLHKKFHNSVLINGDTSAVEKQRAVDRLQNDSKTNLLLGNIQAAGVGLTLTAASNVAFIELPWVPALVIQAEDRCNRIGSVYCTNIYYLLAKNTIEEQLFDIINMKQKLVDRIIDGVDTMEETSVFDEMVSLYSK